MLLVAMRQAFVSVLFERRPSELVSGDRSLWTGRERRDAAAFEADYTACRANCLRVTHLSVARALFCADSLPSAFESEPARESVVVIRRSVPNHCRTCQ